jgi:hypothetical protein
MANYKDRFTCYFFLFWHFLGRPGKTSSRPHREWLVPTHSNLNLGQNNTKLDHKVQKIAVLQSPQRSHFHMPVDTYSNITLTCKFKIKQPEVPGFIIHETASIQLLPVSRPAPFPVAFCGSEPPKLE